MGFSSIPPCDNSNPNLTPLKPIQPGGDSFICLVRLLQQPQHPLSCRLLSEQSAGPKNYYLKHTTIHTFIANTAYYSPYAQNHLRHGNGNKQLYVHGGILPRNHLIIISGFIISVERKKGFIL